MTGPLPRLLSGVGEQPMAELGCHTRVHGMLPDLRRAAPAQIIEQVERAGLRGRGGASFPMSRKLQAVASRRGPKIVVANGSESEPASSKDRVLLRDVPHLVLDGAASAARAVGAREAIVALSATDQRGAQSVARAMRERGEARLSGDPRFEVVRVPERYLSGQESALVNLLSGGPGLPTFGPRPFEAGVRRRATLVQNVETLAHLGLILRRGSEWFRELGTPADPGSALVTVSGAVPAPGVYEIEQGTALTEVLSVAGTAEQLRAVLIGGYFGSWLAPEAIPDVLLAPAELAPWRASLGAGVIVALGVGVCPVAECARIADWFSAQSAGQCGPCVHGLAAIADTVQQLATGTAARAAYGDLARWSVELPGRGACQHPDGAVRFFSSALRVFAREFDEHARRGPCDRCSLPPMMPAPVHSTKLAA
jgi:NADH:ubiquinone oxidoreductase subunit F (NADH-binding)